MGEKKIVKSTCKSCHGGCGVLITVEDGVITHIEGNPEGPTWGTMCAKIAGVPVIISNRRDTGFWRKKFHIWAYRVVNRWVKK